VLSSVVPMVADLLALRRVPAHSFGIFMSMSPLLAAAVGAVILGEALGPLDWVAIGLIVAANAVALAGQTSTTTDSPPADRLPERMVAANSAAPAQSQAVT
jgi:inner membrane transporter RhtA